MLSELEKRHVHGGNDGVVDDLDDIRMLLSERPSQDVNDFEKEFKLFRSGSAPPTVEGSLDAIGGLFGRNGGHQISGLVGSGNLSENGLYSEEELRSDPGYLSYYYSNVNLNPRLPPSLLTKEDSRFVQRLKCGNSLLGGIGDRRRVGNSENGQGRSMFEMPIGFSSRKEIDAESKMLSGSSQWGGDDGLIGLSGLELGRKHKSVADILQDNFGQSSHEPENPSPSLSRNAFDETFGALSLAEAEDELAQLRQSSIVHSTGTPTSFTYDAVVGSSLSRNATPDPQLLARAPSPSITPIGSGRAEKRNVNSSNSFHVVSTTANESAGLAAELSGLVISSSGAVNESSDTRIEQDVRALQSHNFSRNKVETSLNQYRYPLMDIHNETEAIFSDSCKKLGSRIHSETFLGDRQIDGNTLAGNYSNPYLQGSASAYAEKTNTFFKNHGSSGYHLDPTLASLMTGQHVTSNLPSLYDNAEASASSGVQGINFTSQHPYVDPMFFQYSRTEYATAAQIGTLSLSASGQYMYQNYVANTSSNLCGLQQLQPNSKSSNLNRSGYYGNPEYGMSYPLSSPLANLILQHSTFVPGSSLVRSEVDMRFQSGMTNFPSGYMQLQDDNVAKGSALSLLDEHKSNNTKKYELSDIAGHVVEFSFDQYGSRFIQLKLETATIEEKNFVYQEIFPEALRLMTDIFGNYVVQKIFEHGLPDQRLELANKLYGNVLSLTLQMFGCRVLQKAIEVVDLDQKIKIVQELDTHVISCVHDQNGNHVIQKCIDCVPEAYVHFIISTLFGQVVTLSTHCYGCRVIQRVLEHCHNEQKQQKVMEEILGSVSMLAQDQYGNYVIQHVLKHGKPHDRSIIIQELSGMIVRMSQQKFASNVVEKCLTYSNPSERKFLIYEIIGTTDENEPLQAMMKDQYANYVVQKVIEICDHEQRKLIMSRIKVHLTALKKYPYAKHIVARIEKLVAAGEKRMALKSSNPALHN